MKPKRAPNTVRLQVGSFIAIPAPDAPDGTRRWAVPGGVVASYSELARFAREHGLPPPEAVGGVSSVVQFPGKRRGG